MWIEMSSYQNRDLANGFCFLLFLMNPTDSSTHLRYEDMRVSLLSYYLIFSPSALMTIIIMLWWKFWLISVFLWWIPRNRTVESKNSKTVEVLPDCDNLCSSFTTWSLIFISSSSIVNLNNWTGENGILFCFAFFGKQ